MNYSILNIFANQVANPLITDSNRTHAAHEYRLQVIIANRDNTFDNFEEAIQKIGSHASTKFILVAEDTSEADYVRVSAIGAITGSLLDLTQHHNKLSRAAQDKPSAMAEFKDSTNLKSTSNLLGEHLKNMIERLTVIAENEQDAEKVRLEAITSMNLLFIGANHASYEIDREPYDERFAAIIETTSVSQVLNYAMSFGIGK